MRTEYIEVLLGYKDAEMGQAVLAALEMLFDNDSFLLRHNLSERSITAKMTTYLKKQGYFASYDVDTEYNRMPRNQREFIAKQIQYADREEGSSVYPDIIIHERGHNRNNFLVIEFKKGFDPGRDLLKLEACVKELHYQHALFIGLGVEDDVGSVLCQWILS